MILALVSVWSTFSFLYPSGLSSFRPRACQVCFLVCLQFHVLIFLFCEIFLYWIPLKPFSFVCFLFLYFVMFGAERVFGLWTDWFICIQKTSPWSLSCFKFLCLGSLFLFYECVYIFLLEFEISASSQLFPAVTLSLRHSSCQCLEFPLFWIGWIFSYI